MQVQCSQCQQIIASENINISKDTAYCESCGNLKSLSSLISNSTAANFNIETPIKGTKFTQHRGSWKIEASHTSLFSLFIIPFTCAWAGGSLSMIYGQQLVSGKFDPGMSLIGLPFLIGSIALISLSLMTLMGRTVISNTNGKASIFIGIGSIGWYRKFNWNDVTKIVEKASRRSRYISLEGKQRLNLGRGLSDDKLYYLTNALRSKLNT